jgi:hypothetical protein
MNTLQGNSGIPGRTQCPDARSVQTTLDILTKEAYSQLGNLGQTVFFFGDGVQRATVDGIFNLFLPQTYTPANLLRLISIAEKQAIRISELVTSPEIAELAIQELRNKLEVFVLVKGLGTILQLPQEQFLPLPPLVEKAYSQLNPFQVLWGIEGLGHYYADSYWRTFGPPTGLLLEKNVTVPAKSLLMLHAGIGLCFGDRLLGVENPTLTSNSPLSEFRAVVEKFAELTQANARPGYLGAVIESLGLVTRDFYPDMLASVSQAVAEVVPEWEGFFWHGAGRALYFSRRYFLPALSTVWSGIDAQTHSVPLRLTAMAGLSWAVVLVNMRQPPIVAAALQNFIVNSPLQDGFVNGLQSTTIMRQDTTPDAPFIRSFYHFRPSNPRLAAPWERLVAVPGWRALDKYYPVLKASNVLGEVFQYQDLDELVGGLESNPVGGYAHQPSFAGDAVPTGIGQGRP